MKPFRGQGINQPRPKGRGNTCYPFFTAYRIIIHNSQFTVHNSQFFPWVCLSILREVTVTYLKECELCNPQPAVADSAPASPTNNRCVIKAEATN